MIDFKASQVRRHRQNIERYCRLLATELTDLERQYLHKRIAEEHAQLERLEEKRQAEVHLIEGATGGRCDRFQEETPVGLDQLLMIRLAQQLGAA
jgi:hypothetical protein